MRYRKNSLNIKDLIGYNDLTMYMPQVRNQAQFAVFPPLARRKHASLYVATIEKAHSIINSLIDTDRLDKLGLVVVDEVRTGEKWFTLTHSTLKKNAKKNLKSHEHLLAKM